MLNWNMVMNIQKYVRLILHNLKSNKNTLYRRLLLNEMANTAHRQVKLVLV